MLEKQTKFLQAMEQANLTLEDVASAIGVTQQTVWQWSQGRKIPNTKIQKQITKLLNCSAQELFGGAK